MNPDAINYSSAAGMGSGIMLVQLALYLFFAYCLFVLAKKMNVANAWMAFIPLLDAYLAVKMAGKPGWWLILLFIPIVNIVIAIVVTHSIVKLRGHTGLFTLGMIFLSIIFLPILAFESNKA
jgi:hypothetical protein